MKKIVSICLVICLILSLNTLVFANDMMLEAYPLNLDKIYETDMYITYMDSSLYETIDIESLDYVTLYRDLQQASSIDEENSSIRIEKIDAKSIKDSVDNPIIALALQRIYETEVSGLKVESINIILPKNESGNPTIYSDEDFWRQNTTYWGRYNGQEIRYYFNAVTVSTGEVNANNIPSTWSSILGSVLKITIDRIIGATPYDKIYGLIDDIASVIGSATPPANYYFSSSTEYIKGRADGTLTFREIVLEDINNKISGHSFYPWGSVQHLSYQTEISIRYYIGMQHGAPAYNSETSGFSTPQIQTSLNYSNTTVLFPILHQYYNYTGYQTYHEYVQININPFTF